MSALNMYMTSTGRTLRGCCHSNDILHNKTETDWTAKIKIEWNNSAFKEDQASTHLLAQHELNIPFVTTAYIYSVTCVPGWLTAPRWCCYHHTRSPAGGLRELAADLRGDRIRKNDHRLSCSNDIRFICNLLHTQRAEGGYYVWIMWIAQSIHQVVRDDVED